MTTNEAGLQHGTPMLLHIPTDLTLSKAARPDTGHHARGAN